MNERERERDAERDCVQITSIPVQLSTKSQSVGF